MSPDPIQVVAVVLFALSILHTFSVKRFLGLAKNYPAGSALENFFQLLGEVEVVFGLWGAILLLFLVGFKGSDVAINYLESRNFIEPAFVFVVLTVCSTRPVLSLAEMLLFKSAQLLPINPSIGFYLVTLTLGPLLGSFITEPAAMTVTALILLEHFYQKEISIGLKYSTIGLLFVNISIGGTLTPYAAPPVLMVARTWGWGLPEMFLNFGWKGLLACLISTLMIAWQYRKELIGVPVCLNSTRPKTPPWVQTVHVVFLIAMVMAAHHIVLVICLFLFFLGFVDVTSEHQESIRFKEGFMVAFFLAGLIVLGGFQDWWLKPILTQLSALPLYLGAIGLTAFTDNAALTYLGSLVATLPDSSKYALVAGAVVGGGLTVIANAPNPAGYSILRPAFDAEGISPLRLFNAALIPTLIAGLCFWVL